MDHKEIRDLAALMKEMGLTVLEYNEGGSSIKMERPQGNAHAQEAPAADYGEQYGGNKEKPAATGIVTVKSPMVGVYYSAPGVDKEPFVSVGDEVSAGDVLCIIEAMKIMNEITAECGGVITEIYAQNKQVVEYGQPLFHIDTNVVCGRQGVSG